MKKHPIVYCENQEKKNKKLCLYTSGLKLRAVPLNIKLPRVSAFHAFTKP